MAVAEDSVSRHPCPPQGQRTPCSATTMCPSSPAMPRKPRQIFPSSTNPPPPPPPPEPGFTQRGHVGVVVEPDARSEQSFNFLPHRKILPAGQVRRLAQRSRLQVEDSGNTDADSRQQPRATEFRSERLNRQAHLPDDRLPGL